MAASYSTGDFESLIEKAIVETGSLNCTDVRSNILPKMY